MAVHESMTRKVESDVLRLIQVSKLHRLRGQWGHLPPQKDGGGGGGGGGGGSAPTSCRNHHLVEKILRTDVFNNILAIQGFETILHPCKVNFNK